MKTQLDIAIRHGLHLKTPYEGDRYIQNRIDTAVAVHSFANLEPGKEYYVPAPYSGTRAQIVRVGRVTPSAKQAEFGFYPDWIARRVYAGDYSCRVFRLLDAETLAIRTLPSHEVIVQEAQSRGLFIPPPVRRSHPHLFVVLPDGVSAERLHSTFNDWNTLKGLTVAQVDEMIADRHAAIRKSEQSLAEARVCENLTAQETQQEWQYDFVKDLDTVLAGYVADFIYYRWLRRQVDAGGPLSMDLKEAEAA